MVFGVRFNSMIVATCLIMKFVAMDFVWIWLALKVVCPGIVVFATKDTPKVKKETHHLVTLMLMNVHSEFITVLEILRCLVLTPKVDIPVAHALLDSLVMDTRAQQLICVWSTMEDVRSHHMCLVSTLEIELRAVLVLLVLLVMVSPQTCHNFCTQI